LVEQINNLKSLSPTVHLSVVLFLRKKENYWHTRLLETSET